jgi:hypothetical protein
VTSGDTASTSIALRETRLGVETWIASSAIAATRTYGIQVRERLTSSGAQRHSSRSSVESYGATTPMPVCSRGGWAMMRSV